MVENSSTQKMSDKPEQIGRYKILAQVGKGGMGVVYKALDTKLDRVVALKTLATVTQDTEAVQRFEREAKSNAKLRHANIVALYDFEQEAGNYFLTMDFIDGGSLEGVMKRQRLPLIRACRMMLEILAAMGYAHQQGLIHRDIKPSNILINKQGKPFITDFGLAKALQDTGKISHTGAVIGTPAYMSPEQARGENLDTRSDLFSLGAMFYQMVCGQGPFTGDTIFTILHKLINVEVVSPKELDPDLPEAVEKICLKSLMKDREQRYQTTQEMAEDIRKFLQAVAETPGQPKPDSVAKKAVAKTPATAVETVARAQDPTIRLSKEQDSSSSNVQETPKKPLASVPKKQTVSRLQPKSKPGMGVRTVFKLGGGAVLVIAVVLLLRKNPSPSAQELHQSAAQQQWQEISEASQKSVGEQLQLVEDFLRNPDYQSTEYYPKAKQFYAVLQEMQKNRDDKERAAKAQAEKERLALAEKERLAQAEQERLAQAEKEQAEKERQMQFETDQQAQAEKERLAQELEDQASAEYQKLVQDKPGDNPILMWEALAAFPLAQYQETKVATQVRDEMKLKEDQTWERLDLVMKTWKELYPYFPEKKADVYEVARLFLIPEHQAILEKMTVGKEEKRKVLGKIKSAFAQWRPPERPEPLDHRPPKLDKPPKKFKNLPDRREEDKTPEAAQETLAKVMTAVKNSDVPGFLNLCTKNLIAEDLPEDELRKKYAILLIGTYVVDLEILSADRDAEDADTVAIKCKFSQDGTEQVAFMVYENGGWKYDGVEMNRLLRTKNMTLIPRENMKKHKTAKDAGEALFQMLSTIRDKLSRESSESRAKAVGHLFEKPAFMEPFCHSSLQQDQDRMRDTLEQFTMLLLSGETGREIYLPEIPDVIVFIFKFSKRTQPVKLLMQLENGGWKFLGCWGL